LVAVEWIACRALSDLTKLFILDLISGLLPDDASGKVLNIQSLSAKPDMMLRT
jgi:hypothetical protein